jgi:hypothetical protein
MDHIPSLTGLAQRSDIALKAEFKGRSYIPIEPMKIIF